jgi:hypothetical protein
LSFATFARAGERRNREILSDLVIPLLSASRHTVCTASGFVSTANPTWTLAALALRSADALRRNLSHLPVV